MDPKKGFIPVQTYGGPIQQNDHIAMSIADHRLVSEYRFTGIGRMISEVIPRAGRSNNDTSGWPRNQNRLGINRTTAVVGQRLTSIVDGDK